MRTNDMPVIPVGADGTRVTSGGYVVRAGARAAKERPIIFSAPMIRALLDGRKTQTRLIVKPQPVMTGPESFGEAWSWRRGNEWFSGVTERQMRADYGLPMLCPHGQPGDKLWVRENFSTLESFDFFHPAVPDDVPGFWYWADGNPEWGNWCRPMSSVQMPRRASRITLEIIGVRVERLQEISEADALAEGMYADGRAASGIAVSNSIGGARGAFASTWVSINGPGSWSANPWVWALEFRRVAQGGGNG